MTITSPADDAEFRDALALLVGSTGRSRVDIDEQINALIRYAGRHRLSLEHCLVARVEGRMTASCLCVDAPGRTASIFIPPIADDGPLAHAAAELLVEAADRARGRQVQLIQAMLRPDAVSEAAVFERAGFTHLTDLTYLERRVDQPGLSQSISRAITWEAYDDAHHALFARVVQGTYEGSLDCGSLNGVRHIDDILASHRGTGDFDPRLWLVARQHGEPVGTVLLNYDAERSTCEVAYMGVLPAFRRQGFGSALMCRAVQLARERAASTIVLSVDVHNTPAQGLYARFGFEETAQRRAWIRLSAAAPTAPGGSDVASESA